MKLHFYCSYQDLCEYRVTGSQNVETIEVYRANEHFNDYMRKDHNHCGNPTSYERNVLSRQGGALIRYSYTPGPFTHPRWTPAAYCAFVVALCNDRLQREREWQAICDRHGWGEEERNSIEPMQPIPAPKYWSEETRRFETEPWFKPSSVAA